MSEPNAPTPSPDPVPPTGEATPPVASLVTTPTNEDGTPKEAEAAAPEPFVAATADDIKLPEGVKIDDAQRETLISTINDRALSGPQMAEKLLGLYTNSLSAASEANSAAWNDLQTKWQDEVKADPTIGGAKWPEVNTQIGKLMEEFGSPKLREALDYTGAGNNPEVVKFFAAMAGKLVETSKSIPGAPVNAGDTLADRAARMYPSATK